MSSLLEFDRTVVLAWNAFLHNHQTFALGVKFIAVYGIYIIPVVFVALWFVYGHKQREYLLSSLLSGLIAWQVFNNALKLFVSRARPDESLSVQELLFRRPDNSFPSDHAALVFGIAIFFWLHKQFGTSRWFLLLAILVGLARVATAVHYPTDIVVGAIDGFLGAMLVSYFHRTLCDNVWSWVIGIARKLKLA